MVTSSVLRLCGIAAVLAGALIFVADPFHPTDSLANFQSLTWRIVHMAELAAFILMLPALVGLYAVQADRAPGLSATGYASATIGVGLLGGVVFMAEFILPVLASQAPALLDEKGPLLGGPFGAALLGGLTLTAAGFVLIGVASVRARVLPLWAGWVLLVAGPLYVFGEMLGRVAHTAGALLFGVVLVTAGVTLVRAATRPGEVSHVG